MAVYNGSLSQDHDSMKTSDITFRVNFLPLLLMSFLRPLKEALKTAVEIYLSINFTYLYSKPNCEKYIVTFIVVDSANGLSSL